MPKSRGSFFAIDFWNAAATRSRASSQVAGRCDPFSRTRGWVKRAFVDASIGPSMHVRRIVTLGLRNLPYRLAKNYASAYAVRLPNPVARLVRVASFFER